MKIMWCGTATLIAESKGRRLLFDPYLKSCSKKVPPVPMDEARAADAIFITHPHLDHFSDADAFSQGRIPVYVSARGREIAERNKQDTSVMRTIEAGDTVRVGDMEVRAYRGRHCVFDAPTVLGVLFSPRTWLHFFRAVRLLRAAARYRIARDDVFVYAVSDGDKEIVLLGSAGMAEDETYSHEPDLLIFPYQGMSRMHRKILPFLDRFRPKSVMIDHFDDAFPPVSKTVRTDRFPAAVKKRLPHAEALIPKCNRWYEI